ncbi:MAG: carbohydrate kinase family protein [Ruminococcaceae bacterium]|nr:carbohydrate kinase family protein [Oscillospiraceae bacterium]
MKMKFLTIGNSYFAQDLCVDGLPTPEREITCSDMYRYPDGSCLSRASAYTALGGTSIACTKIGADVNGTLIERFLQKRVDFPQYIFKSESHLTGTRFYLKTEQEETAAIQYEGANSELTALEVKQAFGVYPDAATVCADCHPELLRASLERCIAMNIPCFLSLTGNHAMNIEPDDLRGVSLLLLDSNSAERFGGYLPTTVERCMKLCVEIAGSCGISSIMIRMENKGTFVHDNKYYYFVPNYDIIPLDSRGATEYYDAALFTRWLFTGDLKLSAEYAAAAETAVLLTKGGVATYPTREDINTFIRENRLGERLIF